ncbi:MAG: hypothetical protein KBA31_13180 [Alphaproteobacteria bacterium]|nr:hypothetical protein [Alphaproteobacteria bacterium]
MEEVDLRADCSRCVALCCVALAFDRSDKFAIDKASGEICRHLNERNGCRIHADREQRGFAGCITYDCHGAGQRVTHEVFNGRSWRDDDALLLPMTDAFNAMKRVHDQLLLLTEAGRLPLDGTERSDLNALTSELNPPPGWTPESLAAFDTGAMEQRVRAFLKSLRRHVAR